MSLRALPCHTQHLDAASGSLAFSWNTRVSMLLGGQPISSKAGRSLPINSWNAFGSTRFDLCSKAPAAASERWVEVADIASSVVPEGALDDASLPAGLIASSIQDLTPCSR